MTWDEYYEKFYDWANSTQISRISHLTSFGPTNELCEVAIELSDEAAATRLIKKAVAAGSMFTADQIIELLDALNEDGMNCVIAASKCTFTREQLDDLCCSASDDILEEAASRSGIDYYGDDDPAPEIEEDDFFPEQEPQLKIGFFPFIKNTFDTNYHNGFIEGNNNFIKVIKRIAFGFRSFRRFKTRIMICKGLLNIKEKVAIA